ncbi:periplasmic solute binding protein [Alcanivorax hongdengensis A-11-3]|uniref:Periplasmic solute binding protein n=2 Tax=Alcanivorax hongdengensis TaxID=519051 RepID=L0WI83_9GAMM|nr:periplasmic solute binding protein [Alcanivorax hongdengensis A-11-3]
MLILGALLPLSAQASVRILACEPEWAELAREVGGDLVDVKSAIAPGQDAHHIQARPSLISQVRRADMVLCNGAELEIGWLPVLLNRGGNPAVRQAPGLFMAADQVSRLEIPDHLDRADGDVHAKGNPHVHLDPRRVETVAGKLAERLATLDPAHAQQYRDQQAQWQQQFDAQITQLEQKAAPLKGLGLITHHRDWSYLMDWLGMRRVDELEPKPGLPPTPAHLAALVDTVKKQNVSLILYRPENGSDASKWLASRTSACAVEMPFSPGEKGTTTLVSLYQRIIDTLLEAREQCHG